MIIYRFQFEISMPEIIEMIRKDCNENIWQLTFQTKDGFEKNIGPNTVAVTNSTIRRNSIPRTKQKTGGIFISYFL